jgi:hypothetical protein
MRTAALVGDECIATLSRLANLSESFSQRSAVAGDCRPQPDFAADMVFVPTADMPIEASHQRWVGFHGWLYL